MSAEATVEVIRKRVSEGVRERERERDARWADPPRFPPKRNLDLGVPPPKGRRMRHPEARQGTCSDPADAQPGIPTREEPLKI